MNLADRLVDNDDCKIAVFERAFMAKLPCKLFAKARSHLRR
jgi:hypothetical protein